MAGNAQATTIDHQGGTGHDAVIHIPADFVARLTGHQRPHVQAARGASTDFQCLDLRYQLGHQGIRHLVTDAHGHRDRHAALATRTVSGPHQCAHGIVQVRIRHQHRVVLRAAQCLNTLAALGAFGIDVLGNRRRTDEAQGFDFRRFDQCVHRGLVAMHHVHHAFWQTGFQQQLRDQQRRTWITLGRLEDEAVTADDRQRVHPQRHHGREVERRDTGHDAQRLEVGPGINVRADVTAVFALEDFRSGTGEFDVLDPALQFTRRVLQGLAMLFADQLRDARFVLLQQLLEAEHHLGTLGRRRVAPGREGGLGGIDGLLNGFATGQWHFMDRLAGGRVEHVSAATVVGHQFTIDQMRDEAHAGLLKNCPHAPVTGRLLFVLI
ncbi:hypothetical protein D3C84_610350 [compost metagenome]